MEEVSIMPIEFHKVSIADARREIEREHQQVGERSGSPMGDRMQQNNNVLLNTTLTWMAGLPKDVRPMVLARRFPRIANILAESWRRVARCEEYFDTLVVDTRGNRTGFPAEVVQELTNLRAFYAELHPTNHRSGWDRVDVGN